MGVGPLRRDAGRDRLHRPVVDRRACVQGPQLEEAKIGVLTAAIWSALATWFVVLVTGRFPKPLRVRALLGRSEVIVDLAEPIDDDRDHIRGPAGAPVTLVEYGDFECPYCGQAEPVVRELLAGFGDLRYVWRHLPLSDVHPRAELAAEASEAAAAQGAFWPMHDVLLDHQAKLGPRTSSASPVSSASTSSGSPGSCGRTPGATVLQLTLRVLTSVVSQVRRAFSSTASGSRAHMTSTR